MISFEEFAGMADNDKRVEAILDAKDELKSLKEHKKKNLQLSTTSMVELEQSDANLMAHPASQINMQDIRNSMTNIEAIEEVNENPIPQPVI